MFNYRFIKFRQITLTLILSATLLASACQNAANFFPKTVASKSLRDIPAQRLNYNYEGDVPLPLTGDDNPQIEKFTSVQADFDARRPTDILDRTIFSPDKQRILAIYRKATDTEGGAFRLDIYGAEGKFLRQITPTNLSLVFPSSIRWSPDSQSIAFSGLKRNIITPEEITQVAPTPPELPENEANLPVETANDNANISESSKTNPVSTPLPPQNVPLALTFATEQIYLVDREGNGLKPLTQKEGLIYFYYTWSPDSSALAALACRVEEWNMRSGEFPNKLGRPRIVEKNGRERLVDDNLTDVFPVWSPDSMKVAVGFGTDIRIYDAIIEAPTSASIPLRVPLFASSQIFDENIRRQQQENTNAPVNANVASNTNANANANSNTSPNTTGTGQMPASFNPIVKLIWADEKSLFFQTGFVRNYGDAGGLTRSYMRWHRLDLSPQAVPLK